MVPGLLVALALGLAIVGAIAWIRGDAAAAGAMLQGRMEGGAAVEGAELWVYPATDLRRPFPDQEPLVRAPVDAGGRFRVEAIPAGMPLWVAALVDADDSGGPSPGDLFAPAREPIRARPGWTVDLRLAPASIADRDSFLEAWRIATTTLRPPLQRRPGRAPLSATLAGEAASQPVFDFEATQFSPRELARAAGPQAAWAVALALLLLAAAWIAHDRAARVAAIGAAPIPDRPPPLIDRRELPTLAMLLLLGLLPRLLALGRESLELNELTYLIAGLDRRDFWHTLLETGGSAQWHAPLWRLLLKATVAPFGVAEVSARLPGALAGSLAVPFTYLLGRRLLPRPAALAAAAAVALSPLAVYYSQDVSPYGLLTALGPASLWLLVEIARRPSRARALALGTCLGLAGATHYYAVHLVPCLILFGAALLPGLPGSRSRTHFGAALALALALALLLLLPVGGLSWISSGQATELSLGYQQRVGTYFLDWDYGGALNYLLSTSLGVGFGGRIYGWGALTLAALALTGLRGRPALSGLGLCILYLAAVETLLTATLRAELYGGYYVAARYWLHFVPLLLLLVWGGLLAPPESDAGSGRRALGRVRAAAALLLCVATLNALARQQGRLDKTDLRGAARHILGHARDGDAVVVTPAAYFALPLQPYLAPESIADGSGLTQSPEWRELKRPGGAGRVLLWEPVTDLFGSTAAAAESRFVNEVWVVDVRPVLFGRPEFSFARADSACDALLGSFAERASTRFAGGVRVHHLSGARARAGTPGTDRQSLALRLGEGDGPFVRGFVPPSHVVSEGRAALSGAEIRLPWVGPRPRRLGLELGHAGAAGVAPLCEIWVDGQRAGAVQARAAWRRVVLDLPPGMPLETPGDLVIRLWPQYAATPGARGLAVVREVVLNPTPEWPGGRGS